MQKRSESFCPDNYLNTDIHIHFHFQLSRLYFIKKKHQIFNSLSTFSESQRMYNVPLLIQHAQSICGCNSTLGRGEGGRSPFIRYYFQEQTHKCKSGASNEGEPSGLGIRYILERIQTFSIESLCKTAKRQVYIKEST